MQAPRSIAILASSRQSRSLNAQIIWNKSTHESCNLMETETICMGSLLLCWTIARLYRVWQKRWSFLETSLATLTSRRLWMENVLLDSNWSEFLLYAPNTKDGHVQQIFIALLAIWSKIFQAKIFVYFQHMKFILQQTIFSGIYLDIYLWKHCSKQLPSLLQSSVVAICFLIFSKLI